jgi:uncharacterized protein (TIGR00369 family)
VVSRPTALDPSPDGAGRIGGAPQIARELERRARLKRPKNRCFGCGKDNAEGMKLQFVIDDENRRVHGTFRLPGRYEGPPAHVHGGIIALLIDEAMGKLNRPEEIVALTAEMSIQYVRPVPLRKKITIEAYPTEHNGRNYWRECTIRDEAGRLLARGKGRFVKVADRIAPAAEASRQKS